jgi:pre-mRNA-splicing factor SYF1
MGHNLYRYVKESMLSAKMEAAAEEEDDGEEENDTDADGTDFLFKDVGDDLDLRLARLEFLMGRRPELLSSVMLRQNPHSVHEWQKRVALFEVGRYTLNSVQLTHRLKAAWFQPLNL